MLFYFSGFSIRELPRNNPLIPRPFDTGNGTRIKRIQARKNAEEFHLFFSTFGRIACLLSCQIKVEPAEDRIAAAFVPENPAFIDFD
jgi:hypothetical protein